MFVQFIQVMDEISISMIFNDFAKKYSQYYFIA